MILRETAVGLGPRSGPPFVRNSGPSPSSPTPWRCAVKLYSARNMSAFDSFTMSLNLQDEQKSMFVPSFIHAKANPIKQGLVLRIFKAKDI
jgi:hypothetical protein